jgi:hypothetical protein
VSAKTGPGTFRGSDALDTGQGHRISLQAKLNRLNRKEEPGKDIQLKSLILAQIERWRHG